MEVRLRPARMRGHVSGGRARTDAAWCCRGATKVIVLVGAWRSGWPAGQVDSRHFPFGVVVRTRANYDSADTTAPRRRQISHPPDPHPIRLKGVTSVTPLPALRPYQAMDEPPSMLSGPGMRACEW